MITVPAVDAVDVTKRYGRLTVVDAITMQVVQGEVYGVLGPNGAGKTTFLRMLFGLIRADAGTIKLFGRTREEAGTRVLDGVSGFIESPKFYPYLTGRKNLTGLARLDGGAIPSAWPRCWRSSISRTARTTRWAATRSGCASASGSPPACCGTRSC